MKNPLRHLMCTLGGTSVLGNFPVNKRNDSPYPQKMQMKTLLVHCHYEKVLT